MHQGVLDTWMFYNYVTFVSKTSNFKIRGGFRLLTNNKSPQHKKGAVSSPATNETSWQKKKKNVESAFSALCFPRTSHLNLHTPPPPLPARPFPAY